MGVVVDNADPEMLGRVRVRVEGLVEKSAWAFPLGHARGGSKRVGAFSVPPAGAEVGVFFAAGDTDHPYFLPGYYGRGEAPGPVGGYQGDGDAAPPTSAEEATKITAFEGERYIAVFDERPGREKFFVRDKVNGDELQMDGVKHSVQLKGTALLNIVADGAINIDAPLLTLKGRPVRVGRDPI